MIVKVFDNFSVCEETMRGVLERSGNFNPFVSVEWLKLWWSHYGREKSSIYIIIFEDNDRAVGFVPLYKIRHRLLRLNEFRLIGAPQASYLDLVCDPGLEPSAIRALIQHFNSLPTPSILQVSDVNSRFSRCFDALQEAVKSGHVTGEIFELYPCPYASIESGWDDFFSRQRDRKSRYNLRRSEKQLSKHGGVLFRELLAPAEIAEIFPKLIRIHSERFGSTLNPLFNQKNRRFFQSALQQLVGNGASVSVIELDNSPISFLIGFKMGLVFVDYAPAFDPAFDKLSLGNIHLMKLIEAKAKEGCEIFDFSKGEAKYKRWWAAEQSLSYLFLLSFNPNLGAKVLVTFYRTRLRLILWLRNRGYNQKLKQLFGTARRFFRGNPKRSNVSISKLPKGELYGASGPSKSIPWSYSTVYALPLTIRRVIVDQISSYIEQGASLDLSYAENAVVIIPGREDYVYCVRYD